VIEAIGDVQQVYSQRFCTGTRKRRRAIHIEHEPGNDGSEVGRLPVAVDERLGKTNVTVKNTFFEECGAANFDRGSLWNNERRRGERGCVPLRVLLSAETMHGAIRQFEVQLAGWHLRKGAEGEPLIESARESWEGSLCS